MNLRLKRDEIGIVITDVQEKLLSVIKKKRYLCRNINLLLYMARILNIPVLVTEHYPKGLGKTVEAIRNNLPPGCTPIEKITFSSYATPLFKEQLERMGRRTIILCGVETHIAVYQTALDLVEHGYAVHVPQDGVASRGKGNWLVGQELLRMAQVALTSSEVVIFQVFGRAGTEEFKAMTDLLKERRPEPFDRNYPRRYHDHDTPHHRKPYHPAPSYRERQRPFYRDSDNFDIHEETGLSSYGGEETDEFRSVFGYEDNEKGFETAK